MRKILFFNLLFFIVNISLAQVRPLIFPEDVNDTALTMDDVGEQINVVGKSKGRGLSLNYTFVEGGNFIDVAQNDGQILGDLNNLQRVGFKLKVPVIIKNKFKLLVGGRYITELYDFSSINEESDRAFGTIDQIKLKTTGFEIISLRNFDNQSSLTLRLKMTAKGDYPKLFNFESRYGVYSAQAAWTKQKSENYEWGLGLTFTHSFRRTIGLPFFLLNKNFNDKWGLEMVLPIFAMMRYNVSKGTILLLGPKFNSSSYSYDVSNATEERQIYNINHSELRATLSLQQKLWGWIWLDAELGFQNNFATDFEATFDERLDFAAEPRDTPYFMIGLFLTPPDDFGK